MDQESDEAILKRVAARDQAAFAALYDRFSGSLYALVKRILENEQDAKDALQEGFMYVWDKAGDYDPTRSKAFTWAVIIFRNKAIDRLRSLRRRIRLAEEAAAEGLTLGKEDPDRADHAAEKAERARSIHRALSSLPAEQRNCIESAFLKGLTHHQLAEMQGTPLGTVKTNIRRGLMRLREIMKGGDS